jgi:hypothetical protein
MKLKLVLNISLIYTIIYIGAISSLQGAVISPSRPDGIVLIADQTLKKGKNLEFILPLRVDRTFSITALTVILDFPSDLITVKSVAMPKGNLIYNIISGKVLMSWTEITPVTFNASDTLLNLVVETTAQFGWGNVIQFTLGAGTEFLDQNFQPVTDLNLYLANVEYDAAGIDTPLPHNSFTVFPNPAKSDFTIKIIATLPVAYTWTLYSSLGGAISSGCSEVSTKENHELPVDCGGLEAGIYLVRCRFESDQNISYATERLIITK